VLSASGFSWDDDYSDTRWAEGKHSLYLVADGFPRLTAAGCPAGVGNVKYTVDLAGCEAHRVAVDQLIDLLRGGRNAH